MPFSFSGFCTKATIITINILFWILSAGLIFLSVWILTAYTKFEHLSDLLTLSLLPACILLASGVALFALGIIGCIGVVREHKCLLGLYFSLLLIAFVGVIASIALAFVYQAKVTNSLRDILHDGLNKYDNDTGCQKAVDLMQSQLHCCGVDSYTDWLDTKWHTRHSKSYPASCCVSKECNYTNATDPHLYLEGCYTVIHAQFSGHIIAVIVVICVTMVMLLLGLISACVVMHKRRVENFIYRDLADTEGMRV